MDLSKGLYFLAGVDAETLMKCPKTDRLWAAHLGFSLILSFLVVGAITYHATSYVVESAAMRLAVSFVVALTVFMFDRALYQADWFLQATSEQSGWSVTRLARILFRLGISLCLSFALAMFLELAIFSDTITERLQEDFRQINAPLFEKALDFEESLDDQIVERRMVLSTAEQTLAAIDRGQLPTSARLKELQVRLLRVAQQRAQFEEDKNAELFGQKTRPGQTGVAGRGRAYQFAEAQIEMLSRQERELQESIAAIRAEDDSTRASIQAQVADLRGDVARLVGSRSADAEEFREASVRGSLEFQKLKNDPLARMQAYAELKEDPENGTAIVLFSWLVRLFVSFLEVVPVAAKMLFCPPSVYGTIVKAEVLRERRRAERMVVESELRDVEPVDKNPARSRASADATSARPRRIPEVILGKRGESATPAVG